MRLAFALIAAALVAGCSSDMTSPQIGSVPGAWVRVSNVPGSSLYMILDVSNMQITGSGTYAIEAGRSGSVLVSGKVTDGMNVTFDVNFDYGDRAHFTGTIVSRTEIDGILKYDSAQQSASVSFRKVDNNMMMGDGMMMGEMMM